MKKVTYNNVVFYPESMAGLSREKFEEKYAKAFGKSVGYVYEKFVKPFAKDKPEPKGAKPVSMGRKNIKSESSSKGSDTVTND